ncbi:MAG: cytochrome c [Pseudomonadales bacterium]
MAGIALLVVVTAYSQRMRGEVPHAAALHVAGADAASPATPAAAVTPARQAELRDFLERNCPACHGTHMTGSVGPPLYADQLAHLTVNAVAETLLQGRPNKGMPPWADQLSREDALWIAGFLKRDGLAASGQ